MAGVESKVNWSAVAAGKGSALLRLMASSRFSSALLATVLIWESASLVFEASRKLFWYDELLTFHTSGLQPFSLFWRALQAGVDGMPLSYYLLVRTARLLPGDPHVTLRLPSILGYLIALLGVYWFARKRLPAFAGLAAVFLITLSPFREYALEARSYSLLVGFLALSAVAWQRIGERRSTTAVFALLLTAAVSFHHLAVAALSAFCAAELTWSLISRRIRAGVWAACLLATAPFFGGLPTLLHYRSMFGTHFWSPPSWGMVISTYGYYLGLDSSLVLVLLVLFGIVLGESILHMYRAPWTGSLNLRDFGPPEIVLVGGFLYFPVLLVVLTTLLHSGYTIRYGCPAILGLVLVAVYLARNLWFKSSATFVLMALLIAFAYQGGIGVLRSYKAGPTSSDERWTSLAEFSRKESALPVVIASPIAYMEAAEYAPPDLRKRLVEVVDEDQAIRLVGTDTPDRTNRILAGFASLDVENLGLFQASHPTFLLRSDERFDWFTHYLIAAHYQLRLLSKDSVSSLYRAERMP